MCPLVVPALLFVLLVVAVLAAAIIRSGRSIFDDDYERIDAWIMEFPELGRMRKTKMSQADYLALLEEYNRLFSEKHEAQK